MELKIILDRIASYQGEPAKLETNEKINILYGGNGSGKTVLSKLFQRETGKLDNSDLIFENSSITTDRSDIKYLVYNQDFIEKNFRESTEIRGVFNLSEENVEAQNKIEDARKKRGDLEGEVETEKKKKGDKSDDKETLTQLHHDKAWKIVNKYKDTELGFCLDGYKKDKSKLFRHLYETPKLDQESSFDIDTLKERARVMNFSAKDEIELDSLCPIEFETNTIENNSIFKKIITGGENNSASNLINNLNISDWVSEGLEYLELSNNQCPFCQQSVSDKITKPIKDYYSKSYLEDKKQLKKLLDEYKSESELIKNPLSQNLKNQIFGEYQDINEYNDKNSLELLHNKLIDNIEDNKRAIESKIESPSKPYSLKETKTLVDKYNEKIKTINQTIGNYNDGIKDFDKNKEEIKEQFWKRIRWDYDEDIKNYNSNLEKLENCIVTIDSRIESIKKEIAEQDSIINEQIRNTKNIDQAISNINSELQHFELAGFLLKKDEKDTFYTIERADASQVKDGSQATNTFTTLSEGEKMIISFLYFIELCKGMEDTDEDNEPKNKIIVIDDPISSLNQAHIYNIAQLIKYKFFESDYCMIFILTHSLYFFRELELYLKNNRSKLYRIRKNHKQHSQIQKMEKGEIQNHYEEYWKILKEHVNEDKYNATVPNCMRNILEHFFAFHKKEDIKNVFDQLKKDAKNELPEHTIDSFDRFINRESHSDIYNVDDHYEKDISSFIKTFEKIFEATGNKEHFDARWKLKINGHSL